MIQIKRTCKMVGNKGRCVVEIKADNKTQTKKELEDMSRRIGGEWLSKKDGLLLMGDTIYRRDQRMHTTRAHGRGIHLSMSRPQR
jgi:hypothetical protein